VICWGLSGRTIDFVGIIKVDVLCNCGPGAAREIPGVSPDFISILPVFIVVLTGGRYIAPPHHLHYPLASAQTAYQTKKIEQTAT
jgi:hypothetical protein